MHKSTPQALPLYQLRRDQGHLLCLYNAGPFCLKGGFGTAAIERVVELREARMADRTGDMGQYNFLSSLLPQDTRVCHQRWTHSLNLFG